MLGNDPSMSVGVSLFSMISTQVGDPTKFEYFLFADDRHNYEKTPDHLHYDLAAHCILRLLFNKTSFNSNKDMYRNNNITRQRGVNLTAFPGNLSPVRNINIAC